MPIEWKCERPDLMVYTVSGKLGLAEMAQAEQESEALISKTMNWKVLVVLIDFEGWAQEEGWADTIIIEELDDNTDRMAISGPPQWRDQIEMFTLKGLRPIEIEYFNSEEEARDWLGVS